MVMFTHTDGLHSFQQSSVGMHTGLAYKTNTSTYRNVSTHSHAERGNEKKSINNEYQER